MKRVFFIYTTNRGAVQFTIAPVVRGKGTRQGGTTAAAVEFFVQMIVSDGSKHYQSGIFISTKEKGEDTEDTELDVDGGLRLVDCYPCWVTLWFGRFCCWR